MPHPSFPQARKPYFRLWSIHYTHSGQPFSVIIRRIRTPSHSARGIPSQRGPAIGPWIPPFSTNMETGAADGSPGRVIQQPPSAATTAAAVSAAGTVGVSLLERLHSLTANGGGHGPIGLRAIAAATAAAAIAGRLRHPDHVRPGFKAAAGAPASVLDRTSAGRRQRRHAQYCTTHTNHLLLVQAMHTGGDR